MGEREVPLWGIAVLSGLTRFGSLFTRQEPAVTKEMLAGLSHHEIVNLRQGGARARLRAGTAAVVLETALAWQVEEGIVKRR